MQFILSAVGDDLTWVVQAGVRGAFADALREAEAILERDPACEAVEIFSEGRFLGDVPRRLN